MSGYQKVYLRVAGLIGDTSGDEDDKPDRVLASGSGSFVPTLPESSGDIQRGPDGLEEVVLPDSIPFTIVEGMVTQGGRPYVWLPVPSGKWGWQIEFNRVQVGNRNWTLRSFSFPLTAATPAQEQDPGYVGINLAYYALSSWSPGEVEALSRRLGDLEMTILAVQRESAAATAARFAAEAAARAAAEAAGTAPPPTWQERFYGPDLPPGWSLANDMMDPTDPPLVFTPPGLTNTAVHTPALGNRFELTFDFIAKDSVLVAVYVTSLDWDGVSDSGRVFLATASDGQGGRAVQLGSSVSASLPKYESLTLVRNGDVWTARADGRDLMLFDGSGPLTHVSDVTDSPTASVWVEGTTVIQATYREIS